MISYNKLLSEIGDHPVVWTPSDYRTDDGKPGVVVLPGSGTLWDSVYYRSVLLNIVEALVSEGFPVITTEAGFNQFGNARARLGIDAAVAWAQSSQVGVRPGKVHTWGFSQGGGAALSYAANNPDKVLSSGGVCPLVDLQIMSAMGGEAKAGLDAAYPPVYDEATHGSMNNPQTMAEANMYVNLPITLCGSSNDLVILPEKIETFKTQVGANAKFVDLGPLGHDNAVPNSPKAISALLELVKSVP